MKSGSTANYAPTHSGRIVLVLGGGCIVTYRGRNQRRHVSPLPMMLALTFSTGVADAVGYLGLDKVFTANMTGNVVILGMAFVGASDLAGLGAGIGLVGFVLGAAAGGRVLRRSVAGWSGRVSVLLAVVAVVLVGLCVSLLFGDASTSRPFAYVVTGVLAAAMGLQASVARHLAVKDITTVVVTSTLTGLASDSRLAGGSGQRWPRRSGAVALILSGAAVGALLVHVGLGLGVAACAIITAAATVSGHIWCRAAPGQAT